MGKIIGIDISKQTFDVRFREKKKLLHKIYDNNSRGFKKFFKSIENKDRVIIVMEASGPYYVKLASYLYEFGIKVSVVNP